MKSKLLALALIGSLGLATQAFAHGDHDHDETAAIGQPGHADHVDRTIDLKMSDTMRFDPDQVQVHQGETIRFVVHNPGHVRHEFVLNTDQELREHYELMKKFPEMEHADPNAVTVDPGKTGEVIWQFTKPGNITFACLEPGHWDAGMKGMVMVAAANAGSAKPAMPMGMAMSSMSANAAQPAADSGSAASAADMTDGEIRKVDAGAGKVTIHHGPIRNLGMPGMTMVFHVQDPAMLKQLSVGEKVRFVAERVNGALTVTRVQPAQ